MLRKLLLKFSLGAFLLSSLIFTACEEDSIEAGGDTPSADTEAGTVSGTVVDAQGKPIA